MFRKVLFVVVLASSVVAIAAPPTTASKTVFRAAQQALENDPADTEAMDRVLRHIRAAGGLSSLIAQIRERIPEHPNPTHLRIVLGHLVRHRSTCVLALKEYNEALRLAPNNPIAHAAVAHCLTETNRWAEALTHLQKAIQHSTSKTQRNKMRAQLFEVALLAGTPDKAMAMYRALVQSKATNVQGAIGFMDKLKTHGLFRQAVEVAREWLPKSRNDPKMHIVVVTELAQLLARINQTEEADTLLKTTLRALPPEHWARLELQASLVSLHRQQGTLPTLIQKVMKWRKTVPTVFLIAQLHEEVGNDDKALSYYRKTLKRRPGNIVARNAVLRIVRRTGDRDAVVRIYEKLVRNAGNDPEYALELAKVYFEDGFRDKGMARLAKLTKRYANDPSIQESILEILLRNDGSQEDILRAYKALIRIEPHDPNHRVALGEFYFGEGQKEEALATWQKITAALRNKERAYVTRARVLAEHDFIDRAVEDFERALALPNARPVVRRELAQILEKAKRLSDAVVQWETLLKQQRRADNVLEQEAREHIVSLRAQLRTLHVSVQTLEARLHANPRDRHATLLLAEAHRHEKEFNRSEQVLTQYLEHQPNDSQALAMLAELYERLNQPGKSLAVLRKLGRVDPDAARQRLSQLARTGMEQVHIPEALEFAQLLVDLHPTDPTAFANLGDLLVRRGDLQSALDVYRRCISLAPSDVNYQLQLADILERFGHRKELVRRLQNILRTATSPNDVTDAGRRLLRIATEAEHEITADILTDVMGRKQRKEVYRKLLLTLYERIARGLTLDSDPAVQRIQRLAARSLKSILDGLKDTDLRMRTHSLRLLMTTRNPQAVPHLLHLLDTHDAVLRSQVIAALATIGSDDASDALADVLKRPDRRVQMDVVWALGAISGPRANKALLSIEQLKGMPKRLHGMRAMALGMQGRAAGTKILVQLHGQQSSTIRMTILWSLGLIGDNTAVDFLIKQLAMESTDTQRMIVWALGASGSKKAIGPLLGLVVSDHPRIAQAAWRSIAWILAPSPQHTQKLREKYLALHDFHRGRLLLTPSSAMNPLMNWPETNTTHAPLLMQAHSGTILKTLLNHIRSADAATRRRTILALIPRAHEPNSLVLTGIEGTPIPPSWTESLHVALLERLEKEPNTGVRAAAALALGYIASDRSIRALGLAILDAPVAVQRASVVALTGIPKRLATTTLIDASKAVLAGQDWPTKTRFAHALGTALSLHPDRANEIVPTLHTLVIDVAIEVRIAALESLLLASSRHRPAIDVLRRRIQEQDPVVAKTTIRLLERWALPESESLINEASHHAHPAIRTAAKAAIQRIQKRKPH